MISRVTQQQAAKAPITGRAFFGVFSRRERWGFSGLGLGAVFCAFVIFSFSFWFGVYPFLAVNERVKCDTLVVEGWVHMSAVRLAAKEFESGGYKRAFTTGGPVQGNGGYINDYSTSASIGAGRLREAGVPAGLVQMVPAHTSDRDRTYRSAVALREWIKSNHLTVRAINVVTEDVHARRTRLLFQKALGDDVEVGIIGVANPDYDASQWWRYSEGVREVIGESIAYLYARFIFRAD